MPKQRKEYPEFDEIPKDFLLQNCPENQRAMFLDRWKLRQFMEETTLRHEKAYEQAGLILHKGTDQIKQIWGKLVIDIKI